MDPENIDALNSIATCIKHVRVANGEQNYLDECLPYF